MNGNFRIGACVGAIAFCLVASGAHAQSAGQSSGSPAPGTGDAQATQPDKATDSALGDIIVTAQRRSESVQKSSLAIEVFSGSALRDAGVSQARDLTKLSPGVLIAQGGAATQIYVRGVGDFTSTPITNPAVAVNVDGIYVARSQSVEGNFFDLERIEVLKGPQGTLYGRNASGGAVNLITNKPRLGVRSFDLNLEGGNYDYLKTEGGVNLPIGDQLAIRGAFQVVHRNGYSAEGNDDDHHESVRLQAYWEPTATLNVRLSVDYSHIGGNGPAAVFKGVAGSVATTLSTLGITLPKDPRANGTDPSLAPIFYGLAASLGRCISNAGLAAAATSTGPAPITGQQGYCPAGTSSLYSPPGNSYFGQNFHLNNRFLNYSAELNWDLGPATLTLIPAHRRVRNDYRSNIIFTFDSAPFGQPERSDEDSVEMRLSHDSKNLKAVIGAYYFSEDQAVTTRADAGLIAGGNVTRYALGTKAYAVFGQSTVNLTDHLRIIGGIRYSVDHKTIDGAGLIQYPSPLFLPGQPCYGGASLCPRDSFVGDKTFRRVSWKAGVEYDLTPSNMLYATVATGHKSGGFNPFSLVGTTNTASFYSPEKVTAYEAGLRNRFLDDHVQLNIEGFYWKYRDAQEFITTLNRTGGASNALTNAGRATIYGADVDLTVRATPNDTFRVAGEYLHTEFDSFVYPAGGAIAGLTTGCRVTPSTPFPIIDCSGNPLPRAPKWSGTASYSHTFPLANGGSVAATAGTQFSSSRYLTIDYTAASKAGGYAMLDLGLSYTTPHGLKIYAFGRNVTNALVYTGAFTQPLLPSLTLASLGAPTTYGVGLSAKW